MKDLPIIAKMIINIILYILYALLISVAFSLLFPIVIELLGKEVLNPDTPENMALFGKIQIFILILVLLVSLILRKYFYILGNKKEVISQKIVTKTVKKEATITEPKETTEIEDDEIKIYVDKEIK